MASPDGGGGPGGYIEGTHCLWIPPLPGHLLQVPGESSCRRGRLLASSGAQPPECQVEVGVANSVVEQGGVGFQDIGTDLFGSGEIGPAIWVRDMGHETAYEEGVGWIPP